MNALTIPNSETTWSQLSPGLRSQLDSDSASAAVEVITASPELLEEATAQLPALKAVATFRAFESGVRDVIGRRFAVYPQPRRTEDEWAAWWADYYATLADQPLCALETAMAAWVAKADAEFLPKPGKLLELTLAARPREIVAYERARQAVLRGPTEPPGPMANPEEVHQWAREFTAAVAAAAPERPELPSIHGKTDAGGITPELRALMRRQRKREAFV